MCLSIPQLQLIQERDLRTTRSAEGLIPTTCEIDQLRLHCIMTRLASVESSALFAVNESISVVFNDGEPIAITYQYCDWINSRVPELLLC